MMGGPEVEGGAPGGGGAGSHPAAGGGFRDDADRIESVRFARLLALLGIAILIAAGVLIALPGLLQGPPLVYLIAFGIAAIFGPVGFTLLAQAWRIRNRALHGSALPDTQRRGMRVLGAALVLVGLFLLLSDFGVSGTFSRVLNLVWGITLGAYGVRFIVRSFLTDRE